MRYKIHFSALTLLCPWTASISQSYVCTSARSLEFRATASIPHSPPPTPEPARSRLPTEG